MNGPGRALAATAKAMGLGVVFALAVVGSALLHLGLPAPRRFATAWVNDLLATTFEGKVVVRRVGVLRLTRIEGADAEVFDPEGRRVLYLQGVRVKLGTLTLLRSLVSGDRLVARIPELTIHGAEVVLEESPGGELGLRRAFAARRPSAGGRGTDISVPEIHLHHAWVHGHLAAAPIIDADLEELAGAFTSTPEITEMEVGHLFVRGRGLGGMNPEGAVQARVALPADAADPRRVSVRYDGRIGEIPVRAEVHGDLPVLEPTLHARIGEGSLVASGTVTLPGEGQPDTLASANLRVKDLDVSLLREGAPRSRLTAALDASVVSHPGGKLSGMFHLESQAGEVSGEVVPELRARGELTERSAQGSAQIAERGAPTTVHFSVEPEHLTLKVDTTIPDLNGIQRVGPIGRGRAHVVAEGGLSLATKIVSVNASAELSAIDVEGVQLARGVVTASAEGPLSSPRVVAELLGTGMHAGGYAFTRVRAGARGALRDLEVAADLVGDDHAPSARARAHVITRGGITVDGAVIDLHRGDVQSRATIASIHVAGGALDVRGLTIEGLGEPVLAAARISASGMTVKARATDVDLARVARLLAREEDARGHVSLDVDVTAERQGALGHAGAEIRDLSVRGVAGGSLRVAMSIEGTRLRGEVALALGEVGKVEVATTEVTLGGPATEPSAWKGATGALSVRGNVDLARLLAVLPEDARPVASASGLITIRGDASRPSLHASPAVTLEASTEGLTLVGRRAEHIEPDGTATLGPPPWHTARLDGSFAVKLDGSGGQSEVSAKLHDRLGTLASVEAKVSLPLADLARRPDRRRALLLETPIEAKLVVPRRSLDAMSPAFGTLPIKGDVELIAAIRGTARAPELTLTAKGTRLLPRNAAACVTSTDLEANVSYDGGKADLRLLAERDGRAILGAGAIVKVDAARAMAGGAIPWEASGDVALTRFPLDTAGALLGQPIAGSLSGKVALGDLHRAASLEADLDLRELALAGAAFPSGAVHVRVEDGSVSATARLDQADGHAETTVTGALAWGAELAPHLDAAKPVDVALHARNFRAAAAMPFVRGAFSELDGRIDTDAALHIEPGGKDGHMDGAVLIRDGVFEVPQIGERFHALRGRIIMRPWGTLRLEDFSAEAPTGKLTASAEAVVKGLALESATARVHVARGESIPLAVEGVPMGRAYGDVTTVAKMAPDGKRLDLRVDVPMLHVDLPRSTGHAVQPLEPDPTIRVGHHHGRELVALPLGPPRPPRAPRSLVVRAAIALGEVEVKRDTTVEVVIGGQLNLEVGDETHLSGTIELVRGKLEVQGKVFTIDHGTVSFASGDPANPLVLATAYWDGPDGTRVYADFSGHVKSGKLELRSEPALTQDEILALLLFGSTDGSLGTQSASTTPPEAAGIKAAGMAAGVVAEGLNKALSGITAVGITTRVDTSKADSPRPELAVQISKKISARLGYRLGVPAPGENPDRTELTLSFRFIRNWSLVAVVGDQGSTTLDVVWRLRY